ncbi:hypothetical protein BDZ45DRAFT_795641 [Acephala macrosclerotiorum]|nr:hypothetical protein BDZ45DRAFT_795641 [Acephala macrosclerotiorum]
MRASTSTLMVGTMSLVSAIPDPSYTPLNPSYIPSIDILPPPAATSAPPFIVPLPDNLLASSVVIDIPPISTYAAPPASSEPMPMVTSIDMVTTDHWTYSTTTVPGNNEGGMSSVAMPTMNGGGNGGGNGGEPSTSTKTVTSQKTATPTVKPQGGSTNGTGPVETSGSSEGRGFSEVKMVALALACALGVFMFA